MFLALFIALFGIAVAGQAFAEPPKDAATVVVLRGSSAPVRPWEGTPASSPAPVAYNDITSLPVYAYAPVYFGKVRHRGSVHGVPLQPAPPPPILTLGIPAPRPLIR